MNLPDVRIDLFKLGFTGKIVGAGKQPFKLLAERLQQIGEITTPKSKRGGRYLQVTLQLETDHGNPASQLRVDLYAERGEDLVFGNRCSIQGNGLVMLRAVLGEENCDGLSFDDKANLLGIAHHGSNLTATQIELLVEAFQFFSDALDAAFGEDWQPGQVWLKSAEACRDIIVEDSISAARIVQHSMMCGATRKKHDEYARMGSDEFDRIPTIRFITHAGGPEDKIYGKRRETLRFEVSCSSRKKVAYLVGRESGEFTAEAVRQLFLNFLYAAAPRIDNIQRHVCEVLSGEARLTEVLAFLRSLLARAEGEGKAKGPASSGAPQLATDAIEALLSTGFYDAHGHQKRTVIRRELDALCGDDGPLERHKARAIYYLKPRFARACGILRLPMTAV